VTGLLPIIALPALGVMSGSSVASTYFNDSVVVCWGSLIIAHAIEKYNLHKRFALAVLHFAYNNHSKNDNNTTAYHCISNDEVLISSFLFTTAFISMWLSNSATAVLMTPLANAAMLGLYNDPQSYKSEVNYFI
jgi:sodium-dependent dicarboxylate transporter 2/3/5